MILEALLLSVPLLVSGSGSTSPEFHFKIAVENTGVYRIFFDDLGYGGHAPESENLSVFEQGKEVPLWVDDGGDGIFNAGDSLLFIGQHLPGDHSWFNEYSRENIYWLTDKEEPGLRMIPASSSGLAVHTKSRAARVTRHYEYEKLRMALGDANDNAPVETWYWQRLSHLDARPFEWVADFAPQRISVGLTGLSQDQNAIVAGMKQHSVELKLNDQIIGNGQWDGQESLVIEAEAVDPELLSAGGNTFGISVPRRTPANEDSPLIDVVLLNWLELEYPFDGALHDEQVQLEARAGEDLLLPVIPKAKQNSSIWLFSPSGRMIDLSRQAQTLQLDEPGSWHLAEETQFLSPNWIRRTPAGSLFTNDQQADYLIIAHSSLIQAVEPLARYHRRQGLSVSVIDIEDIFNRFSHGVASPAAVRDFIRHSFRHWRRPAPRYVLLAGDASWDIHDPEADQRNLVPTLRVLAHEELAASDNGFVAIDGDGENWRPALAIGRIPAADAQELSLTVGKIIRYQEASVPGPWRRSIAWITDRNPGFQDISDQLADRMGFSGFTADRVYPAKEATQVVHDQEALKQAFREGPLVVHFLGHGGRYVWRTGPPDYRDSSDLFSIADIEGLEPVGHLPMVLSMTCSSGPFDHPRADSIAEAFLRLPQRGAIAVLAASWRISASAAFSAALTRELTTPGASIGEAVMRAKQEEHNRSLVESYNLLGDPAMRLSLPAMTLPLTAVRGESGILVSSSMDLSGLQGGQVIVDWLDSSGRRLKTVQHPVSGDGLEFHYLLGADEVSPAAAAVYIWHTDSGQDGLGTVKVPEQTQE